MSLSGSRGDRKVAPQEMMVGRTLQQGAYVVEAVLGHGGMGQVFLASHAQVDVPVAIKQVRADEPLPPAVIEELDHLLHSKDAPTMPTQGDFPLSGGANTDRFLREALLMARLRHPAIPLLYDYFFENGYWYLVMEYVPGSTLSMYVREHAPLPQLEAINYALQICDVLTYLHAQNPPVVFRDLKPANIIMHPDGRLMIVDFGIARYFKAGQFNDTTDFGSPGYASPEQYEGIGQTDARSDLFSLGVILHEMLSGQRPTRRGVAMEQLESLHKLNPGISPALSGLVMVATRTEPMYRFQSAHTFYQALERVRAVEERRAYRYHTLVAEVSSTQKTRAIPMLIPPPSSQGFVSEELAREQDQRAQHMRMREQTQRSRSLPRANLEQEALAHQLTSIDASLKMRTVSASQDREASRPPVLSTLNLNEMGVGPGRGAAGPSRVPPSSAPPTPALVPTLPPSPQKTPLQPQYQAQVQRIKPGRLILSFCLLLLLISGSFFAYRYLATRAQPHHPQMHTTNHPALALTAQAVLALTAQASRVTVPSATWQDLAALPSVAADNTALYVQVQGQAFIYLTGGFRGAQASPVYSQGLYRYNLASASWEKVNVANFPAMGNNAAALDEQGNLFFTGGYSPDLGAVSAHLYEYQPTGNTLRTIDVPSQVPLGFGDSMLADQQGHLYLDEGFLTPGDSHVQAGTGWYRYDIAAGIWHTLASLPQGLGYVQLAQDNAGSILLIGGSLDAGQSQSSLHIYRYNIQQDAWTQFPMTLPSPLSGAASCSDGQGHLVMVGGYDPVHNQSLNTVQLLDLTALNWKPLPSLPNGGSLLGTAVCDGNGHVYITRGANDPSKPTSDFLELTLPKS